MVHEFKRRRDAALSSCVSAMEVLEPHGAFYLYTSGPAARRPTTLSRGRLRSPPARGGGRAVVPGAAFGTPGMDSSFLRRAGGTSDGGVRRIISTRIS
jgi:aspartate/methionine/tyrosine aminotransferase